MQTEQKTRGKKSTSGVKGVSWHSIGKKWRVHACFGGAQYYVGLFSTLDDAAKAHRDYMAKNHV